PPEDLGHTAIFFEQPNQEMQRRDLRMLPLVRDLLTAANDLFRSRRVSIELHHHLVRHGREPTSKEKPRRASETRVPEVVPGSADSAGSAGRTRTRKRTRLLLR